MLDEQVAGLNLLARALLGSLGRLLPLGGLRVLVDVVRLSWKIIEDQRGVKNVCQITDGIGIAIGLPVEREVFSSQPAGKSDMMRTMTRKMHSRGPRKREKRTSCVRGLFCHPRTYWTKFLKIQ